MSFQNLLFGESIVMNMFETITRDELKQKLQSVDWLHYIAPGYFDVLIDKRLLPQFQGYDNLATLAAAAREAAEYIAQDACNGEQECFLEQPIKATYYTLLFEGMIYASMTPFTMEPLS
jgi:hypothetical protein